MRSANKPDTETSDLDWLVNDFVRATPGAAHAIVVSSDGMPLAVTNRLGRTQTDQLATIMCGLASIASGVATLLEAAAVRQTIVEMTSGFLLIVDVPASSRLAVLATASCDIGVVSYQATMLATQAGRRLSAPRRSQPGPGQPA